MTETTSTQMENNKPQAQNTPLVESTWYERLAALLRAPFNRENLRGQLEQAVGTESQSDDIFSELERVMIANILRFGALRVEDVMVPRADIVAIDIEASLQELLFEFERVGHSRIPVYRGTLDDPTGMVHVKDLLRWIVAQDENLANIQEQTVGLKVISGGKNNLNSVEENKSSPDFSTFDLSGKDFSKKISDINILREVLYVPPSMPVVNLLLRMQSTRVHLALVVDEYGGTDGLVSIEDLVEEVVGEIEDEHDEDNGQLISGKLETGLVASARTPIEDLEQLIGIDLFENEERDDDIDTLGGLVFSLAGRVPVRGEIVTLPTGHEIEVLSADPRRIKTLKIIKKVKVDK